MCAGPPLTAVSLGRFCAPPRFYEQRHRSRLLNNVQRAARRAATGFEAFDSSRTAAVFRLRAQKADLSKANVFRVKGFLASTARPANGCAGDFPNNSADSIRRSDRFPARFTSLYRCRTAAPIWIYANTPDCERHARSLVRARGKTVVVHWG